MVISSKSTIRDIVLKFEVGEVRVRWLPTKHTWADKAGHRWKMDSQTGAFSSKLHGSVTLENWKVE